MWQAFLDLLFPKKCIGCKTYGEFLCSDCFCRIEVNTFCVCPVCLRGSIDSKTHPACQTQYGTAGLISATVYKGITKKLVYQYKYQPYLSSLQEVIGKIFIDILEQNELFYSLLQKQPVVTSIPLSSQKLKKRGYNHSSLLARHVAQYFHRDFLEDVLIRVKDTKPLYKLSKNERISEIHGAFVFNEKYKSNIRGKTIFIVDDIATTCTTLRETSQVLRRNGAKEVWGITFAKEL